jgi:hypothetical protein
MKKKLTLQKLMEMSLVNKHQHPIKHHCKWSDRKDLERNEIEKEKKLIMQKLMEMTYVTELNTLEKHYYKWGDKNFINVANKKCRKLLLINMNVGDYRWKHDQMIISNYKWAKA